jgi:hypothetical protein
LYVDGALVGSNNNMTLTPADLGPTVNNWLGRSQWNGDAPFYGAIDEFRIYNAALSHDLVTSNYLAGPDALLSGPVRFIAHPQDQTVTEGDAVTLSAQADGTPPISFRWHRDGQPCPVKPTPPSRLPRRPRITTRCFVCGPATSSTAPRMSPAAAMPC